MSSRAKVSGPSDQSVKDATDSIVESLKIATKDRLPTESGQVVHKASRFVESDKAFPLCDRQFALTNAKQSVRNGEVTCPSCKLIIYGTEQAKK